MMKVPGRLCAVESYREEQNGVCLCVSEIEIKIKKTKEEKNKK